MRCSRIRLLLALWLPAAPLLAAQTPATTRNPLDELRDQAGDVLARAGVPFSEEQEKVIALMIEDRLLASEQLFGDLMDYRGGPVEGQQQDRAVAAITWMHDEFRARLREYLTAEQVPVWERYESGEGVRALERLVGELTGGSEAKQETQFIRIINNAFTAEQGSYSGQAVSTDVISRGGIGAFHGNVAFELKDESLDARNPFAHNKPPYQERQLAVNLSGPLVRDRLTIEVGGSQNERENVGTIHAVTTEGPFDLGIVRPSVDRSIDAGGTYQVSEAHSLMFGVNAWTTTRRNQGIGGFTLPERASEGHERSLESSVRHVSVVSGQTLYATDVGFGSSRDETRPVTNAMAIDVLGAFGLGGSQNRSEDRGRSYRLGHVFTRTSRRLSLKAGVDAHYDRSRSLSEDNVLGSFTFSDLDSYRAGVPLTYRVTRGDPSISNSQLELSAFVEHDLALTPRLAMMVGVRYDRQTNLHDRNNAAPRLGVAYAAGRSTVIRAGAGVYYQRLAGSIVETQRRLDGSRQYEIVISDPSYPDPFHSGTATTIPPSSIRVTDPRLVAPYEIISSASLERRFRSTLMATATYEFRRGVHLFRSRDLNAPLPGQAERPDPGRGNVLNLESTGRSRSHALRASVRQRFSIFNVNASYRFLSAYNDSAGVFSTPSNNYDLRSDWGRSGQPRHQMSGGGNARLWMGVFLAGTVSADSGGAYSITTGRDDNADTNVNDRPPGVRRNSGDGPRFIGFNFNISKAFFLGGTSGGTGSAARSGANVNVFANMTNAFNRTNYGLPSGVMTSPFFGRPFSARSPREIEVGLRLQF